MKILCYTDVHWCQNGSVISSMGEKYSTRLENLIKSVNWAEETATKNNADMIVCCGDFFDRSNLNDMEITAWKEVKWARMPHYVLVGNHDSSVNDLSTSSTNILSSINNIRVISKHEYLNVNGTEIDFIPYVNEEHPKIIEFIKEPDKKKSFIDAPITKRIVFSHNDIAGIRYGKYMSTNGFELDDISSNCNLFLNGHLHNSMFLDDKETILNIGNLTGLNFSEDAFKYKHYAVLVDTETLELSFFVNPYAFNFYRVDIDNERDISVLDRFDDNAVVAIRCVDTLSDKVSEYVRNHRFVSSRITTYSNSVVNENVNEVELKSSDYKRQFETFIVEKMGNDDIVHSELSEVLK